MSGGVFPIRGKGGVVGKQVQAIFTFGCLSTRENQKIKNKLGIVTHLFSNSKNSPAGKPTYI